MCTALIFSLLRIWKRKFLFLLLLFFSLSLLLFDIFLLKLIRVERFIYQLAMKNAFRLRIGDDHKSRFIELNCCARNSTKERKEKHKILFTIYRKIYVWCHCLVFCEVVIMLCKLACEVFRSESASFYSTLLVSRLHSVNPHFSWHFPFPRRRWQPRHGYLFADVIWSPFTFRWKLWFQS